MSVRKEDVELLARAWLESADYTNTPDAQEMIRAEVKRIHAAFEKLKKKIEIIFTDHDPYANYEQMHADVVSNKRMLVYKGGSDTPLWTPETNWKARAVHDWDHITHSVDFSMTGEAAAFRVSAARMPGLAPLYLSEVVLQAALQNYTGSFAPQQKLVLTTDPRVERAARSLRGLRGKAPTEMVWRAAGMLKFMSPKMLMLHLRARGLSQEQAVVIASAALMLHSRQV